MSPEQVQAHDTMILWRVYASNAKLMLAVSGRDSLFDELMEIYPDFDLRRVLMDVGALLDGPAGPAIVSDAWKRVRESLLRNKCSSGPDCRSVFWCGKPFAFTASQAACVRIWMRFSDTPTPDIGDETVLAEAGCETKRISDLFKGHPAWGAMIVEGATRGTHRIAMAPKEPT